MAHERFKRRYPDPITLMAFLRRLAPADSDSKYCRPIAVLGARHRYHGRWRVDHNERGRCASGDTIDGAGISTFGASAFLEGIS